MPAVKSKRVLHPGRRVKVLIVDDSLTVRHLVARALEGDPDLEVAGTAANGKQALEQVSRLEPDVVTLDIEMPEMDGLEALRNIRHSAPQTRIIMLSRLTGRGDIATLDALTSGADDYLKLDAAKSRDDAAACLRDELRAKIKQFFIFTPAAAPVAGSVPAPPAAPTPVCPVPPAFARTAASPENQPAEPGARVVAIGISTGGPSALASILHQFPRDFSLPILIVQHMPPQFTKLLCERLQGSSLLPIREAVHLETVRAGVILVAPGNHHMRVGFAPGGRQPRILLDQEPHENSCRPAVDPLFASLAGVYGGAVIAAVMTGMGHDGLRGARLLKAAGAVIFAQDEASSAVWGMPRAIAEAGLANAILPLSEIIPQIVRECRRFPARQASTLREAPNA